MPIIGLRGVIKETHWVLQEQAFDPLKQMRWCWIRGENRAYIHVITYKLSLQPNGLRSGWCSNSTTNLDSLWWCNRLSTYWFRCISWWYKGKICRRAEWWSSIAPLGHVSMSRTHGWIQGQAKQIELGWPLSRKKVGLRSKIELSPLHKTCPHSPELSQKIQLVYFTQKYISR